MRLATEWSCRAVDRSCSTCAVVLMPFRDARRHCGNGNPDGQSCEALGVQIFLETDRMVLRRFTMDDVDPVLALDSDPLVRRFVEDGEPVTREEVFATIEHWLRYHERSEIFGFWAAIEKESGQFLGWFHFRPRPDGPQDEPELGYRLISAAWGQGYGTEGSRALIDKGFESPHVSRVVAETMAVHTASRRVMEKAGMRHVRSFATDWPVRLPGDEEGDVEYAISRAEWEAGRMSP
jgi:RimJ/RimL family protein N-acetyltransferase